MGIIPKLNILANWQHLKHLWFTPFWQIRCVCFCVEFRKKKLVEISKLRYFYYNKILGFPLSQSVRSIVIFEPKLFLFPLVFIYGGDKKHRFYSQFNVGSRTGRNRKTLQVNVVEDMWINVLSKMFFLNSFWTLNPVKKRISLWVQQHVLRTLSSMKLYGCSFYSLLSNESL